MDEYERKHFQAPGRVIYRDKVKMAPAGAAMIGLTGLVFFAAGAIALATGDPQITAMTWICALPLLGLVPVFGAVRLLVTDRELRLQVGVGGPRVEIENIESVRVLGAGERGTPKAKEYPLKNGSHGLELHLRDGDVVRIRTDEARVAALAAAVAEARQAHGPQVRVELDAAEEHQDVSTTSGAQKNRA